MDWLNNPYAQLTDWYQILGGEKLQRGIVPSDIDGIIESGGYFLALEVKHPGEETSPGQARMLWALSKIPRFTVIKLELNVDGGVATAVRYGDDSTISIGPGLLWTFIRKWIDSHS